MFLSNSKKTKICFNDAFPVGGHFILPLERSIMNWTKTYVCEEIEYFFRESLVRFVTFLLIPTIKFLEHGTEIFQVYSLKLPDDIRCSPTVPRLLTPLRMCTGYKKMIIFFYY